MRQQPDSEAGSPVSAVARRALTTRFKRLKRTLARCGDDPDEAENVHQLRVATRRLDAALALFSEVLPSRRLRKLDRSLRRLRRITRDVRDLDVLAERLSRQIDPVSDGDVLAVVAELRSRRMDAATRLRVVQEKLARRKFARRSKRLLKRTRWRGARREPSFAEAAGRLIRPVVDQFLFAAESDLSDVQALHQFRLRGKRLRYSLELLAGALDPHVARELTEALQGIQERLGDVNDHATAEALLAGLGDPVGDRVVGDQARWLLSAERQRRERGHAAFLEWWRGGEGEQIRRGLADVMERLQRPMRPTVPAAAVRES